MLYGAHPTHIDEAPSFSADGTSYVWGGGGVLRFSRLHSALEGVTRIDGLLEEEVYRLYVALYDGTQWRDWGGGVLARTTSCDIDHASHLANAIGVPAASHPPVLLLFGALLLVLLGLGATFACTRDHQRGRYAKISLKASEMVEEEGEAEPEAVASAGEAAVAALKSVDVPTAAATRVAAAVDLTRFADDEERFADDDEEEEAEEVEEAEPERRRRQGPDEQVVASVDVLLDPYLTDSSDGQVETDDEQDDEHEEVERGETAIATRMTAPAPRPALLPPPPSGPQVSLDPSIRRTEFHQF